MSLRQAWQHVAHTSSARVYWMLTGLVVTLVTARELGPELRGVFVTLVAWVRLFAVFGSLSLPRVLVFLAAGGEPREWVPPVGGTSLALAGLMAVAGWMAAAGLIVSTGGIFGPISPGLVLLAFASLPALLLAESAMGILTASNRLRSMNLAQVAGGTASVAAVIGLAVTGTLTVASALTTLLVASGLTAGLMIRSIIATGRLRFDMPVARRLIGGGMVLHLNAVAAFIVGHGAVFFLAGFRAPEEAAFYHLGLQFVAALQIVPGAVGAVAYAVVSREGPDSGWLLQRRLLFQTSLLMSAVIAAAILVLPSGVRLLLGEEFVPAVGILRVMTVAVPATVVSTVIASQWIARGLFGQIAARSMAVAALNLVANYAIVPEFGAIGAAWVAVATSLLSLAVHGSLVIRLERARAGRGAQPVRRSESSSRSGSDGIGTSHRSPGGPS
jgi:O-antigen/teichoic acid export membrane protein